MNYLRMLKKIYQTIMCCAHPIEIELGFLGQGGQICLLATKEHVFSKL